MCENHGSYDLYQNKTSDCKLGYLTVMYPIYLVFGATRRYFYTQLLKQIKSNSWKTEYKMFLMDNSRRLTDGKHSSCFKEQKICENRNEQEDEAIEIWLLFDYLIIYLFSFLTAIEVEHHIVQFFLFEAPRYDNFFAYANFCFRLNSLFLFVIKDIKSFYIFLQFTFLHL